MIENNLFSRKTRVGKSVLLLVFLVLILPSAIVLAAPASNRIFTLKNISASQAIEIFNELNIGQSVNKVKNVNAIIVTDYPKQLVKAKVIVGIVDSKTQFNINQIETDRPIVLIDIIAHLTKNIADTSFGTFKEPPIAAKKAALVDIHNGEILVISSADITDEISANIQSYLTPTLQAEENAITDVNAVEELLEEADVNAVPIEQDEMFNELITALEKAEETKKIETEDEDKIEDEIDIADFNAAPLEILEEYLDEDIQDNNVVADDTNEPVVDDANESAVELVDELEDKEPVVEAPKEEKKEQVKRQPSARTLAEPVIPDGNMVIELELPERVEIISMLDLLGEYLGLDYIYDADQIKGNIMLKVQGPITIRNLYAYVEAILKSRGFVMIRGRGNLVMIVKAADAVKYDPTIIGSKRDVKAGDIFVTNVFKLNHIETPAADKLLKDMKLGSSIVQVPETKTIIVTDYAYRMQRIEDLLMLIDKPGDAKGIEFRDIRYITVSSLIPKLESLAAQLGTISITTTIQPAKPARKSRGKRPPPKPPTATQTKQDTVFLEADERTNRIIMIGTDEQIETVNGLIDSLDIKQQDLCQIRSYEIQNVAAEEVATKLEELGISATGSASKKGKKPAPSKPGQPAGGGISEDTGELAQVVLLESTNSLLINATNEQHEQIEMIIAYVDQTSSEASVPYVIYQLEYQKPDELADVLNNIIEKTVKVKDGKGKVVKSPSTEIEDITVVADEASFSLIVYASRKNQDWIGKLIASLDQKRPQVLIDVTLVEITKTDSFEADLDIISAIPDMITTSGQVAVGGLGTAVVSKLTDRSKFIEFGSDSGTGKAFYGDKSIQALLTLVESKGYGRVLAKPKILVNDNEEGVIETTNTTYVTKIETSQTDTVVTEAKSYPSYDAGIKLLITPHISEGNLLLLEIDLTRSDFTGELGQDQPPDTVKTEIGTLVTVPDQKTIILGGLLKLNQGKGGDKVPVLGDIPLIGGLFRSTNNSDIQSKLYVFVKAQISRPSDTGEGLPDLVRISRQHSDAFEEEEEKFQKHEATPGVKPEPMDPVRVLEMR